MKHRVLIAMLATAVLLPALAAVIVYSILTGGTPSTTLASGPPPGPYRGSEPPAQIQMPQFALRDYKRRVIRSRELLGRVTLVTFLDTDCTTKCPIIAAQIGDGLGLLTEEERRDVVPLASEASASFSIAERRSGSTSCSERSRSYVPFGGRSTSSRLRRRATQTSTQPICGSSIAEAYGFRPSTLVSTSHQATLPTTSASRWA